ncbi:MAG: tRNA (uridine(54)-C5)-methyltransferase TrmA [Neisseriaceae bacterium]
MLDMEINSRGPYAATLKAKEKRLGEFLKDYLERPLRVFPSPEKYFRMRAEFRIWHVGDQAYYAMFPSGKSKQPIFLENFAYASQRINQLMAQLKLAWVEFPELKEKLFQVEFLTTLTEEALITLCYHRKLDQSWLILAKKLAVQWKVKLVGRSRKQQLCTHEPFVVEKLEILGRQYTYVQPENSFTQPNTFINKKMLSWAVEQLHTPDYDLLELYCGNGNFTLPLSSRVRRVLATETNAISVHALAKNISLNKLENISYARLSAEELIQAVRQTRTFKRLAQVDLTSYNFATVLVDPPRCGLDILTCQWMSQFPNILYISCNPNTLVDNLKYLTKTHQVRSAALFDQFPFTEHIETGLFLSRR